MSNHLRTLYWCAIGPRNIRWDKTVLRDLARWLEEDND